jgi:hypothetical protein
VPHVVEDFVVMPRVVEDFVVLQDFCSASLGGGLRRGASLGGGLRRSCSGRVWLLGSLGHEVFALVT